MPASVALDVDWDVDAYRQIEESYILDLLRHGLAAERRTGDWQFAIRFVDDAEIGRLHDVFLGDPAPTDIITFPYDPEDGEQGGDIVISVETASRNAADHDWAPADELAFLVLHGLLHVLGWHDGSASERSAMLARQQQLLDAMP